MKASVLVLGGGFAGVESAIELSRRDFEVTLVSDRSALWLYPVSIWVPTAEASEQDVSLDLPDLARRHGFTFQPGAVRSIDPLRKRVVVDDRERSADYLVLAFGAARLQLSGAEHTHTICGQPSDTLAFRDALQALARRGEGRIAIGFGGNPKDPSAMRGGPAFEMMFNIDTWLRRRGLRDRFELTFFAPMESPGQRMGPKAVAAIGGMFGRLGIGQRYGRKIVRFAPGAVIFEDDSRLEADLIVFVSAGHGHPLAAAAGLPLNPAGFVEIDEGCGVRGLEGVYAVGDVAALDGPEWRAKQGHVAEVMARVAAHNIAAHASGDTRRESYLPHVGILCVMDMGNGAAWVSRDERSATLIPLPIVGHWMKQGWGQYYRLSRKRLVPRLPGM